MWRGHSSSTMSICRVFLAMVAILCCQPTAVLHVSGRRHSLQNETKMTDPVSSDHPNLYFSAEDVLRLRNEASTSRAGLYKKLVQIARASETSLGNWEKFSTEWNAVYGNTLAVLATYCVLTPRDGKSLAMTKRYMERLARLPSWRVKGKQMDDVPVAHTLLGFVTAFDFLHASLTRYERARCLAKMRHACQQLYVASTRKWWGRSYIQNHVATNYVALFTAALVLRPYYPDEANAWLERSVVALDNTMTLLRLVVDGSFQEGVSYGSYTFRSLTQFMYLAERHFNQNYRDNNWVREHFNFLLHSTLPGYQMTVGIADSIKDWAYGPESQLNFLENYVHRDGRAIWLANRIKSCRPASRMENLLSNAHSTLYTEILFYNDSLGETSSDEVKLHVFSDWGVITYGGGTPAGNAFLSFKCGRLHGRAMNMLWSNLSKNSSSVLNPGHEQPDHGSFVYIAKEQPVITESFYGPKFTFLENVLMFGHSRKPSCSSPYLGQLGECHMWFNHKEKRTWQADGELVGYSQNGDVVFMSGDMTGWYDRSLGLQSVYRALIMLSPSILVVVDTIRLRPGSPTRHVSAFFHNADLPFNKKRNEMFGENPCAAKVGQYSMCCVHLNGHAVNVTTRNNFTVKRARYTTNFINVTSRFRGPFSSTTYIFHGPNDALDDAKVFETRGGDGVLINLKMNSGAYDITLSARHENPRMRRRLLGSSGYGKLRVNRSALFELGLKTAPCDAAQQVRTSPDATERDHAFASPSAAYVAQLTSFVALLCLFLHFTRRFGLHPYIRWTMFGLFILWLITFFLCFSTKSSTSPGSLPSGLPSTAKDTAPRAGARTPCTRLPPQCQAVVAMGLPLGGAEIARELFTTNTDFAVLDVPSTSVVTPSEFLLLKEKLDLCEWRENDDSHLSLNTSTNMAEFVEWWKQVLRTPWKIRKNKTKDYISLRNPLGYGSEYGMEVTKSEGALAFVHFRNPGWLFRISWLNTRFLADSLTPVLYVVRDPRSWIEHLLSEHDHTFLQQLDRALRKDDNCKSPSDILAFQEVYDAGMEPYVVFAHIWVAFTSYASKLMATLPSGRFTIVRLENLTSSPKETSEDVYSFLRMPFPAAVEHRILQVTKSEIFELENYGVIDRQLKSWGEILSDEQVFEIERICGKMMSRIGYT